MTTILHFLFSLDRLTASDLLHAHYSFALGEPWIYLMLLLAVVLACVGYWSYRGQSASPAKRVVLGIIRAVTLVVVALLFCRPQATVDQEIKTPSVVAVWVDDTRSMELQDPYRDAAMRSLVKEVSTRRKLPEGAIRPRRWDLALDALTQARGDWLKKLAEEQEIALFTGGVEAQQIGIIHRPEEVDEVLARLNTRAPEEDATDVPAIAAGMFRRLMGQPVSALVLFTDGRSTEGMLSTAVTTIAQQYHTPIFALPVGQSDEPLNLRFEQALELPESTFSRDPVAVKLKMKVTGIENPTTVKITLSRKLEEGGEEQVLQKDVTAEPGGQEQTIELIYKPLVPTTMPAKSQRFDLIAQAEPIGDELTLADNVASGTTTVMDAQITVLLIDGSPRWEFRYLKNELLREKTVNVSTLQVSADEGFAQEGNIPITRFPETEEELRKYDVLLIGDVEPEFFSPNQMRLIVDFVKKWGGGLGMIAGPLYNPNSYKGTPIEALLPIVPDDPNAPMMARLDNAPFTLRLTSAGRESNLFRFFDDPAENLRQMEDNPPMYWFRPVLGLKGAAEVLAEHPLRTLGGIPAPLIVTGRYGAGRVVYSAVADTWRWRRYKGEPLYQSYWLQMCRLLYREKALGQNKRIELLAENPRVEVGAKLRLTAHVTDASLTDSIGGAAGQIVLNALDEAGRAMEPVTLSRVGNTGETYQGVMTPTRIGKITLIAAPGALPVEVAPLTVLVERPQREFVNSTVDLDGLATLTSRTEGKILPLQDAGQLATLISDKSQLNDQPKSEELWSKPLALFLVVALLTAEWLVRKAAGLI